jgi:hypothetical protein
MISAGVGEFQGFTHHARNAKRLPRRERAASKAFGEVAAFHVFHHVVKLTICGPTAFKQQDPGGIADAAALCQPAGLGLGASAAEVA